MTARSNARIAKHDRLIDVSARDDRILADDRVFKHRRSLGAHLCFRAYKSRTPNQSRTGVKHGAAANSV